MSARQTVLSSASFVVFAVLDFVDLLLCFFYRLADYVLDRRACPNREEHRREILVPENSRRIEEEEEEEDAVSETLYERRNIFQGMGPYQLGRRRGGTGWKSGGRAPRWSDCGCKSCVSWREKEEQKLHFVVKEPSQDCGDAQGSPIQNVIFLHGFLCSSLFWVETVFKNLSERADENCRLFAVDLLGFGESPKPADCLYRLKDHVQMIEQSIIEPLQLRSFHLVAHSMGCIIALALAAKHRGSVQSVTFVAPPYFPSPKEKAGEIALNKLAERTLWPPMLFASAVMSWYEHLGRTTCLILCRNHRTWEWLFKLVTRRDLPYMLLDLTRHTHHSGWNTMHNVICGGAKLMDKYLETLSNMEVGVKIIHGDKDQVVSPECSWHMKQRIPHAMLQTVPNSDHSTIIVGREKEFMKDLEDLWFSTAKTVALEILQYILVAICAMKHFDTNYNLLVFKLHRNVLSV